jgi:hypothetical protein
MTQEILKTCRAWPGQVPLVLVLTSYLQLFFAEVAALGKVAVMIQYLPRPMKPGRFTTPPAGAGRGRYDCHSALPAAPASNKKRRIKVGPRTKGRPQC